MRNIMHKNKTQNKTLDKIIKTALTGVTIVALTAGALAAGTSGCSPHIYNEPTSQHYNKVDGTEVYKKKVCVKVRQLGNGDYVCDRYETVVVEED